ncbi:MAG: Stp1/IreP family PP2C-type Ser/Thr phosphatase [Dehalococcoidales bacterium]
MNKKMFAFETATLTDTGLVRVNNEDYLFAEDISEIEDADFTSCGIYIIADGMGGHQAGEIASGIAVKKIAEYLKEGLKSAEKLDDPNKLVNQAIEGANREIYDAATASPELFTMGTTVTLGFRLDKRLFIGHVGDSRAYLLRKGRLHRLTEDHSLVARLVKEKVITPEEAKIHPDRNKIFRCLGIAAEVEVDSYRQVSHKKWLSLDVGDTLMFCSDGLSGYVEDAEIQDCLLQADGAERACRELVNLANLKGGEDNISVIVVRAIKPPVEPKPAKEKPDTHITRKRHQNITMH